MAELADAPDLGSGVYDVQVQVLSSAGDEEWSGSDFRKENQIWIIFYNGNMF